MEKTRFTRPVIVVDVDGIVADFWFSASQVLRKMFGRPIYPVNNFEALGWGLDWLGFTNDDEKQFWSYVREADETFWANEREIIPGIVRKFYEASNEKTWYWCTTREDLKLATAQEQTEEFLYEHGFPRAQVIVSDRKEDFCYAVRADYFLDDKFMNCKKVREKCPDTKVFFLCQRGQQQYLDDAKKLGMAIIFDVEDFIYEMNQLPFEYGEEF